jgi:VanZ family protein
MAIKWFVPAFIWFIISFILLTLPGDNLPHNNLFNIPFFDKYVHTAIFALLTILFAFPYTMGNYGQEQFNRKLLKVVLVVIAYGIAMEFVQKYFARGRSFDVIDIFFDSVGSLAGVTVTVIYYRKKIGPDGNRGRNQN